MVANQLAVGDVRVGHVFEGYDQPGPAQGATLTFDGRGAELQVAYLVESEIGRAPRQFARANAWFDFNNSSLPKTLLFADSIGWVTLSGARVSGGSLGSIPSGRVRARSLIFGRPRMVLEDYSVAEMMSTIDGLDAFARFKPIKLSVEHKEDGGHRVEVVVDASESVSWNAGGFSYTIHANVSWTGQDGTSFEVLDGRPFLQTVREGGATIDEHYEAQFSIRALLVLVHGSRLSWRSHKIRDDQFPMWMLDGSDRGPSAVEVFYEPTVGQYRQDEPDSSNFVFSAFRLQDVGTAGLAKWIALYADEDFRRAVEPAVEVINGATKFLEPQLMMLAISLDRFGYFRFGDGKRRPMHEHIVKCLEEAGLDWPEIGSRSGIAKAIGNVNNDLKHPDRAKYPETDELAAITRIAEIVARCQIFDVLGIDPILRDNFVRSNVARHAVELFTNRGIVVTNEGYFARI